MASGRIVVIGTSAGGIEALRVLVGTLPADFPAPICVVMHTSPESPGILPDIIDRAGPLRAVSAHTGQRLQPGVIYVAPPDCHLLVEPGLVRTTRGPRENRFRPAIDPLFRSAAQVFGPAAIGVVLTGNLDDGAAGLWTIKQLGGIAVVQDPEEAMFPSMPLSAMRQVAVDHVVRLAELGHRLTSLVQSAPGAQEVVMIPDDQTRIEVDIAREEPPVPAGVHTLGEPSPFACPDCHGVLLRLKSEGPLRFRCHTGHAFTAESLLAALREETDETLWNAVRSLQEGALLMEQMAGHAAATDQGRASEFEAAARDARQRADHVRQLVLNAPDAHEG
ncbi:MAG TPA: chemotaxis protein CheB [Luteitalea sp.]|nr:chemotaxis protein CheB [Luteitalea sp.]